jgi:DmsE family decaheme c-type cytochrome
MAAHKNAKTALRLAYLGALIWTGVVFSAAAIEPAQTLRAKSDNRFEICRGCHAAQYDQIRRTRHWLAGDTPTPANTHKCATCHGDLRKHLMTAGKAPQKDGVSRFTKASMLTPEEQNAVCLGCHRSTSMIHWPGSGHDLQDVGCIGCHRIHTPDKVLKKRTQQQVCFACHANIRMQVHKPFGHPLREGLMTCSDCHAPHGGPGDGDLKAFSVNEVCYSCHAEKRGPFLWEHPPASEDCLLCHSAHGSIHPSMLARREPHLCQSCHEPTAMAQNPSGPHARHSRLALSFRDPDGVDLGPEPAASAGISRFVLGQACSNCHSQVHGSNHPAGAKLTR